MTKIFFSPFSFFAVFGSGIRDPGSRIRDPGWVKPGSGIRDKHPGSATLAEYSLLRAKGLFCSLDSLYRGLGKG
jgi:hypothetical protein